MFRALCPAGIMTFLELVAIKRPCISTRDASGTLRLLDNSRVPSRSKMPPMCCSRFGCKPHVKNPTLRPILSTESTSIRCIACATSTHGTIPSFRKREYTLGTKCCLSESNFHLTKWDSLVRYMSKMNSKQQGPDCFIIVMVVGRLPKSNA